MAIQEQKRFQYGMARWIEIAERLKNREAIDPIDPIESPDGLLWNNEDDDGVSVFCEGNDCDLLAAPDNNGSCNGCLALYNENECHDKFCNNPSYDTAMAVVWELNKKFGKSIKKKNG